MGIHLRRHGVCDNGKGQNATPMVDVEHGKFWDMPNYVHSNHIPTPLGSQDGNMGTGTGSRMPGRAGGHQPNTWNKPKHFCLNVEELGTISTDGRTVDFDKSAFNSNFGKLRHALFKKIIGRRLPLNILDLELHRRWECFGSFQIILIEADCFICMFESIEARDAILLGGPWQIARHIIGLDRWSSSFSPDSLNSLSSPIWIRLPWLPLLYWDMKTIGKIVAMIGEPLWLDAQTRDWSRSTYARACVRIDLLKKLPTGVWVQGKNEHFFQRVEFEGISVLCFNYGIVGHKNTNCPVRMDHKNGSVEDCGMDLGNTCEGCRPNQIDEENINEWSKQVSTGLASSTNYSWEHGESSSSFKVKHSSGTTGISVNSRGELGVLATKTEEQIYGPWTSVTRCKKNENLQPNAKTNGLSSGVKAANKKNNGKTAVVQHDVGNPMKNPPPSMGELGLSSLRSTHGDGDNPSSNPEISPTDGASGPDCSKARAGIPRISKGSF